MSVDCKLAQFIEVPGPITSTANQPVLSISCWINCRTIPAVDNFNLAVWTTPAVATSRMSINCRNATPGTVSIIARAQDADALTRFETVSATVLQRGVWINLIGVVQFTTRAMKLYVNGVNEPLALSGANGLTAGNTQNTNSARMRIGANPNAATELFDGLIEDVRLYQRFISAEEAMTIYQTLGRDKIDSTLAIRYPLLDLAAGETLTSAVNITDNDRIIGTNTSGTALLYGNSSITTVRGRQGASMSSSTDTPP